MNRLQFETLFLHARLLPEIALAQMAQEIIATALEGQGRPAGALQAPALAQDADSIGADLQLAPGLEVDWFGASGLEADQWRQLRESAQRELAAFDAAATSPLEPDGAVCKAVADATQPGWVGSPAPGLEDELRLAYAQRDQLAPIAQRAFAVADLAQLEALLARVPGDPGSLLADLCADDLARWLERLKVEEAPLLDLLRVVAQLADPS